MLRYVIPMPIDTKLNAKCEKDSRRCGCGVNLDYGGWETRVAHPSELPDCPVSLP